MELDEIRSHIARLPYPEAAREALLDAIARAPAAAGLRAAYARPGLTVVAAQPEALAERYRVLTGGLPKHPPFGFMPLAELVLRLAIAASLLQPERPLVAGTNEVMAQHVVAMRRQATLRMMLEAGQGIFEYLELVTGSAEHFYNFGRRAHRRLDAQHMVLLFEDFPPELSRYWLVGLNQGLLRIFAAEGTVAFVPIDESRFELHVQLVTP